MDLQVIGPSNLKTLITYDTEYCADSVEWCPHSPFKRYFVCGNYQLRPNELLQNSSHKRFGRILFFSFSMGNTLNLLQTIDTSAVLDLKWCHNQINGFSLLGVVNAQKTVEIYRLDSELSILQLITSYVIENDNDRLILSLDWSTNKYPSEEPFLICSDSLGDIHKLQFVNNQLILVNSWKGHEYEAWIAAFYYWDPNVVLTGGDDSLLLMFDLREGVKPVIKNRCHEAGVTCIHSNVNREHIVGTGSYDNFLHLWDLRQMKKANDSIKMPGTLWRLKWDPFTCDQLLCACMSDGLHVVEASNPMKIVHSYHEHKNIVYGADWCHLEEEPIKGPHGGDRIIASCSFYDHLLCISKIDTSKS